MEEITTARAYKPTKNQSARIQLAHFGKILFGLQFIPLAIILAGLLSAVVMVFLYLIVLLVLLATLFLILIAAPDFISSLQSGEVIGEITQGIMSITPYTASITLTLSVLSIVFLCCDFRKKDIPRIVVSSVVSVLAIVALAIFYFTTGGTVA